MTISAKPSTATTSMVPADRISCLNRHAPREDGQYVLYWMTAYRRVTSNYALQHAVEWAGRLTKPLLILEGLQSDYPWSSPRFHHFVADGMKENARATQASNTAYYPYIEPTPGAGKGLLRKLSQQACLLVTDDYPCFFLPELQEYCSRLDTLSLAVDSNGILPMRHADKTYTTAYSFRRFLQKELRPFLAESPSETPLAASLPNATLQDLVDQPTRERYPAFAADEAAFQSILLPGATVDPTVRPTPLRGGSAPAQQLLAAFLQDRLAHYIERNHPDDDAQSHLSPYLHFGHISAHQILTQILAQYPGTLNELSTTTKGSRSGWWNLPPEAEGFLDQLITWREIGFNMCFRTPDYTSYDSLPNWALDTLQAHADDPRPTTYSSTELESACTEDPIWNACQHQLATDGFIHNYLRMLWGKKILQWSKHPRDALDTMIHLNNKYALDGRDPNSYSGIFWVLGRYDRAWGPERSIFGKVRYMTSENTRRKLRLKNYLERYQSPAT